jgi:prepilin-type N-terminal cleavage/methylation domain-containing protein
MLRGLRRLRARLRARAGFSLIEIMVVLLILAVGVIPIAVVQHQARREVTEADRHTDAIVFAQGQLERLKAMGFGNVVPDSGVVNNITWTSRVNNVSFGLDRIDVIATWGSGRDQQTLVVSDLVSMR